ncbi:MAG: hypothetical protein K0A92_08400 [Methyloprofundus sp.]|nr:hypothetical protein [Methyloprofundus sp.]
MSKKLSKERRALLVRMESILGNECYNANIQNYGPGGAREAAGRNFRYPVMLRDAEGSKSKVRESPIPATATDDMVRSGYYAFGANQLDVMAAKEKVLQYIAI